MYKLSKGLIISIVLASTSTSANSATKQSLAILPDASYYFQETNKNTQYTIVSGQSFRVVKYTNKVGYALLDLYDLAIYDVSKLTSGKQETQTCGTTNHKNVEPQSWVKLSDGSFVLNSVNCGQLIWNSPTRWVINGNECSISKFYNLTAPISLGVVLHTFNANFPTNLWPQLGCGINE